MFIFCFFISMAVMAVSSSAATPTNVGYQFFLSDFIIEDSMPKRIISGEIYSPSRQIVEVNEADPSWNILVNGWLLSTMDLSDLSLIGQSDKAMGYYEAILFDVFCEAQDSEESVVDLVASAKATELELSNLIIDAYGNILKTSLKDLQEDSDKYKQIKSTIDSSGKVSDALGLVGDISEYGSNLSEIITNCSRLQAVAGSYVN